MITAIIAALRRTHRRWRTARELNGLTDRQLSDIGLSRSDVLYVSLAGRPPRD